MAPRPISRTLAVAGAALVVAHILAPAFLRRMPLSTTSSSEPGVYNAQSLNAGNDATKGRLVETLSKLPLRFEETPELPGAEFRFVARGGGVDFGIKPTEVVTRLQSVERPKPAVALRTGIEGIPNENSQSPSLKPRRKTALLRMQLVGGNWQARVIGENQIATRSNYFIGSDPRRWQTDVPNYQRVRVEQVYRGVDVIYYGS